MIAKGKKKKQKSERLCIRLSETDLRKLKRISNKHKISITDLLINSALHTPNDYRKELNFTQAMVKFQSLINEIQDGNMNMHDYEKCQEEVDNIWKML